MPRRGKVLIAMSGGVDSSVAAWLLREQGYDCVGVFMRVGAEPEESAEACSLEGPAPQAAAAPARRLRHGCCSATDALDARAVAARLDMPFYVLNFRPDFERIIDYFVEEYRQARTPNPCVMCNIHLKFGKLLRYADALGAEFVATGHYARILPDPSSGAARLARAVHLPKDQSYVLFGIRRTDLARCLFPLGEMSDKAEVRRRAAELGLRVHDKPDSQEICFVPNNDYRELVRRRAPQALTPGEYRDAAGAVLGHHAGIAAYTIGQRRGLGLAVGLPVYVTGLNPATNVVTLGAASDLLADVLRAGEMNWLADPPAEGVWLPVQAKIRHQHSAAAARVRRLGASEIELRFDAPQSAITPGQAVVLYDGPLVLGGGWIREVDRTAPAAGPTA